MTYNQEVAGPVVIEEDKVEDPRYRKDGLSGAEVLDLYKAVGLHKLKPGDVHKVGLLWEPEGYFRWYFNDTQIFEVRSETLHGYKYEGVEIGDRLISREASYINLFLACPLGSPTGSTPACPID